MPACPRSDVFDPTVVGCYCCTSTCVRRAALCGDDPLTGQNYDHRKEWLEQRLAFLASLMALDVLGNSAIANQHTVVLRNRPDLVEKWSDEEVARRWLRICPGSRGNLAENPPEPTEERLVEDSQQLAKVRGRLSHISWFMRFVNEYMSHRANQEEGEAKGRFWAGRFNCKGLLDTFALLLCAMHVDSTPMRAGVAETPETSRWTSAYRRIRGRDARLASAVRFAGEETATGFPDVGPDSWLTPIDANQPPPDGAQSELGRRASDEGFLQLTLDEYLQLLAWTGQQIPLEKMDDAAGAIPVALAAILQRFEIDAGLLVEGVRSFATWFSNFAGRAKTLLDIARRKKKRWLRGMSPALE